MIPVNTKLHVESEVPQPLGSAAHECHRGNRQTARQQQLATALWRGKRVLIQVNPGVNERNDVENPWGNPEKDLHSWWVFHIYLGLRGMKILHDLTTIYSWYTRSYNYLLLVGTSSLPCSEGLVQHQNQSSTNKRIPHVVVYPRQKIPMKWKIIS